MKATESLVASPKGVNPFGSHGNLLEQGKADMYNACEWGNYCRVQDTVTGSRQIGRRGIVILIALLWAGGARAKVWLGLGAVAVTGIVTLVAVAPYRLARFTSFLDPFADPTDGGFQAIRGMYALATGGLYGERAGDTPIGNLQTAIGRHEVVFRHPDLGESRHTVTVTASAPARVSVDMRKK